MTNTLNTVVVYDDEVPTQVDATYSTVADGDKIEHKAVFPKDSTDATQTNDYVQKLVISNNRIYSEITDYYGEVYETTILETNEVGLPVAGQQNPFVKNAKVKDYGDGTYWKQPSLSRGLDGFTSLAGLFAVVNSANPIVNGDVIATIPDELAPNLAEMFIVGSNIGQVRIDVKPTGEIVYNGTASITQYVSMSGIRFLSTQ